jgi:hypothetical protein
MGELSQRQKDDLRYISDPMLWVDFLCPVKKWEGHHRVFAYLSGDGPNLYMGNIWNPKPEDVKVEFESYKAIVDAGWEVD